MSVAEAQRKISSEEFTAWKIYDSVVCGEPERSDIHTAMMCTIIASVFGGRARLEDFMPPNENELFDPAKVFVDGAKTASDLRRKAELWLGLRPGLVRRKKEVKNG